MKTEFDTQATDFLSRFGLKLKITLSDTKTPSWGDDCGGKYRPHYRVTLAINKSYVGHSNRPFPHSTSFDFFGSIRDGMDGTSPSEYSVLACISSDIYCPDTFADFCSDYGYDEDSRTAEKQFRACSRFAKQLRAFFTPDEIKALQEIH